MKLFIFLFFLYPRIEVLPRIFDAGRILEGDEIRVNFTIRNKGDDILKIINIEKDCGCTFVIIDKNTIEPGDSTSLKAGIVTEGKKEEFEEEILIHTNDPYEPFIRLKIKAHIFPLPKPELKSVEIINVGNLYPGEIKDTFFYVKNTGDAELILLGATPSPNCEIISDFPIHIAPDERKVINIEVAPVKTGFIDEEIKITTNIKGYLYHFIKIRGRVHKNYLTLFSPLIFNKNGDTLYIFNSGKKEIMIKKILIEENVLLSNKRLKPKQKIKIFFPLKMKDKGDIEVHLKLPYIVK